MTLVWNQGRLLSAIIWNRGRFGPFTRPRGEPIKALRSIVVVEIVLLTVTSREFATELGIALASDLTGFKYPAAFPTPPETLKYLIPNDDGDDGDISDLFSPRRNEFIWFFYLAEISLRRTFDEVLSVVYDK